MTKPSPRKPRRRLTLGDPRSLAEKRAYEAELERAEAERIRRQKLRAAALATWQERRMRYLPEGAVLRAIRQELTSRTPIMPRSRTSIERAVQHRLMRTYKIEEEIVPLTQIRRVFDEARDTGLLHRRARRWEWVGREG